MSNAAQTLPDDPALLKSLIAALQAENAKISPRCAPMTS